MNQRGKELDDKDLVEMQTNILMLRMSIMQKLQQYQAEGRSCSDLKQVLDLLVKYGSKERFKPKDIQPLLDTIQLLKNQGYELNNNKSLAATK